MTNPSPYRKSLLGFTDTHDRLWLIHTPDFIGAITDYNWEVTGVSRNLADLDHKIFHYGGNAYYIIGHYAREKGYRVEKVEDRR